MKASTTQHPNNTVYHVRSTIGVIAISLPAVLSLGGFIVFQLPLEPSFSAYYYTPMQDMFVGLLFALGILLIIDHQYLGTVSYTHLTLPTTPYV